MTAASPFQENRFIAKPIRDLGLTITNTPLNAVDHGVSARVGADRDSTVAAGFLFRPRNGEFRLRVFRSAFPSILRSRHWSMFTPETWDIWKAWVGQIYCVTCAMSMGHVVNYAYRLYEEAEWIRLFGSMSQPYLEEYRPEPFSQRFVWHLPGLVRSKSIPMRIGRERSQSG